MITITQYEHVGIRVTNRETAIKFYNILGFQVEAELPEDHAIEMVNAAGVYINLITNAASREGSHNVLQDEVIKLPGITHPAFIVNDLDEVLEELERNNLKLSGGPFDLGRRRICFIRDPDGTVIEFDEMS